MLHRLFIEDDTDYIEQDIEQLKVLFFAEGEGLPIEVCLVQYHRCLYIACALLSKM